MVMARPRMAGSQSRTTLTISPSPERAGLPARLDSPSAPRGRGRRDEHDRAGHHVIHEDHVDGRSEDKQRQVHGRRPGKAEREKGIHHRRSLTAEGLRGRLPARGELPRCPQLDAGRGADLVEPGLDPGRASAGSSRRASRAASPRAASVKSCTSASTSAAVPANGGMNGLVRCNCAILSRFWSRVHEPVSSIRPLAPSIGMTDAALETINLGTVLKLVVGIVQAIAQRIRIIGDRAGLAKSFELILAERIGIEDLADRVGLADSFTHELTSGRRRERDRAQEGRREAVDVQPEVPERPQRIGADQERRTDADRP